MEACAPSNRNYAHGNRKFFEYIWRKEICFLRRIRESGDEKQLCKVLTNDVK